VSLIENGVWPNAESATSQNLAPLAPVELVARIAPDESGLFMHPPPFITLTTEVAANPEFWREFGALDEIEPDLALDIGDFGAGSDAAIVLDYRGESDEPRVLRLQWGESGNHWVVLAETFEVFAEVLSLVPIT